jgi:hypothetical protein
MLEASAKFRSAAIEMEHQNERTRLEILAIIADQSLTVPEVQVRLTELGYRHDTRTVKRVRELLEAARLRQLQGISPCHIV